MVLLLVIPALATTILFAPGLYRLMLSIPVLDVFAPLAANILGMGAILFFVLAAITAKGTYNFRYHVLDMLPWALIFIGICALAGALRGS